MWTESKESVEDLIAKHSNHAFGLRSLGHWYLSSNLTDRNGAQIALQLYYQAQYVLSCKIFQKLHQNSNQTILTPKEIILYGSGISEQIPTLDGVKRAHEIMKEGLKVANELSDYDGVFFALYGISGLLLWKWRLDHSSNSLGEATHYLIQAIDQLEVVDKKTSIQIHEIARAYLRAILLLRQIDQSMSRPDSERYRDAILSLDKSQMNPSELSHLTWYKAIVYADIGNEEQVREHISRAVQHDEIVRKQGYKDFQDIGATQYKFLKRFIVGNLPFLRNHTLIGYISQALQRDAF